MRFTIQGQLTMGIIYRIDKQRGISFVVWDGVITAGDFIAQAKDLVSDPDWPACRRLYLVDTLTASIDASIDETTFRRVTQIYLEYQEKLSNTKVAVAASELFMNAIRFEETMSHHPISIIVFNSLETACMWLGIDSNQAREILQGLRIQLRKGISP